MPARILIVDDEPHIRTVMRLTLEASGHTAIEAATGEEALELIGGTPRIDVVLLDERMPGIDGLETLERLREHDTDAIVIMVTAFASVELAVEAMKIGAADFLRKPMSPDTLRAAVDNALAKTVTGWPTRPAPAGPAEFRYEVWSMNGFRIRHTADGASPTEHLFAVSRGRDGAPQAVTVEFAPTVVAAATGAAGRSVGEDRVFWRRQGGLALLEHLWTHAAAPATGRLVITGPSTDLLASARRDASGRADVVAP
jgi:DNA-binding response OmpR family regulator